MQISVDTRELDTLTSSLMKQPGILIKELDKAMSKSIVGLRDAAVDAIQTGDTRAVDTGHLKNSHRIVKKNAFHGEVTNEVEYGPYVHYGTSKMRARPWLARGIEKSERNIKQNFQEAINDTVKQIRAK